MFMPQSHWGVQRQCQAMPAQSWPPLYTAFQRMATRSAPDEESDWLALIFCVCLHDIMALSWLGLKGDHGCCHCLLNIAICSGQRIQIVAWVLSHLKQEDWARRLEGKAIRVDLNEGSSCARCVFYCMSVLLFVLVYAFSRKFKLMIKWSSLQVFLTLIPTFTVSLQSLMSDIFPFPRLFIKLPISHVPFIFLFSWI